MEENDQQRISQAQAHFKHLGKQLAVMMTGIVVSYISILGVLYILALFLASIGVGIVIWLILEILGSFDGAVRLAVWMVGVVSTYAVGIPLGTSVLNHIPPQPGERMQMQAGSWMRLFIIAFPVMVVGNLVGSVISAVFSGGQLGNPLAGPAWEMGLWGALLMAGVAPILEEYLFRKQIMDRCMQYGEKTSIVFSALTFALFQMDLTQFFTAFGMGMILAYLYARTRCLRSCIIMHIVVKMMGTVLTPWAVTQIELARSTPESVGGLVMEVYVGYILVYLALAVAGLVLLLTARKKLTFAPASQELPKENRLRVVYDNDGMIVFISLCVLGMVYALWSGA